MCPVASHSKYTRNHTTDLIKIQSNLTENLERQNLLSSYIKRARYLSDNGLSIFILYRIIGLPHPQVQGQYIRLHLAFHLMQPYRYLYLDELLAVP